MEYRVKRDFSYDPVLGIKRTFHGSEDGNTFVIQTTQETEDIVESNKTAFNDAPERWGEFTRVASIPISIYWDLKKKGIADDDAAMKRWLNSSDNRFFRTRGGRV
jgi:hypothetical protein